MSLLVIGIGHPFRRDDAVGWRVADRVERLGLAQVTVLRHHGEGTDLMARWQGHERVVLVDATCAGSIPGTVRHWDDPTAVPAASFPKSSHVFGLAEALSLAASLGRLPPSMRVVGIEGADFSAGEGLDPRVMDSVDAAVMLVVNFMDEG
ncbi:MAG: hydrogenase maturation protease [Magnetospirillum sp.]|nr:hydrogenase maturation protease [Magnetospirillum sp.]